MLFRVKCTIKLIFKVSDYQIDWDYFTHISRFFWECYKWIGCLVVIGSAGKESACNAGDLGLIPGLGRSPGEGNSYPLQYSGLENSMECIVLGVTKSRTRLSEFHFTSHTCKEVRQLIYIYLKSMTLFEEAKRKKKPDNDNFPAFSLSLSSDQIVLCFTSSIWCTFLPNVEKVF